MLHIGPDLHSLTNFKRCTSEFIKQLHQTGRPIVLTLNAPEGVIVQNADAYQEPVEEAESWYQQQQKAIGLHREMSQGAHAV